MDATKGYKSTSRVNAKAFASIPGVVMKPVVYGNGRFMLMILGDDGNNDLYKRISSPKCINRQPFAKGKQHAGSFLFLRRTAGQFFSGDSPLSLLLCRRRRLLLLRRIFTINVVGASLAAFIFTSRLRLVNNINGRKWYRSSGMLFTFCKRLPINALG